MTLSNHREPPALPPTQGAGSEPKSPQDAAGHPGSSPRAGQNVAAVVEKFNKAFLYRPGDLQVRMPVSDETIFIMSNLARIKGRADLADELRALIL